MKNGIKTISKGIIAFVLVMIQLSAFSEENEREWSHDVIGMWHGFDRFANAVVERRDSAPFLEREFY